jgi:hypothetical protein
MTRSPLAPIALLLLLSPALAHAECSYRDAQEGMIEANNLLATYAREATSLLQAGRAVPPALEARVEQMNDVLVAAGKEMERVGEAPDVSYETPVDPALCATYRRLVEVHAPAGYEAPTLVSPEQRGRVCGDTDGSVLAERMGSIITRQQALAKAGRVDQARLLDVSQHLSRMGSYMATDPVRACEILDEVDGLLDTLES